MIRQLLNNIHCYLNGHSGLQDLEVWLLSNLQRILDSGDQEAIRVANQVDADLVEVGEGLLDEATFRERLEGYVRFAETIRLTHYETEPRDTFYATAAVETFRSRSEIPTAVVDLRLAPEFV